VDFPHDSPVTQSGFRPLVVCYHAVSDSWPHVLAVSPARLERQLGILLWLGYRPARLPSLLGARGRALLHVTFDDAYASVSRALPILERLGVPCTIFVCSDYAVDGRPLAIPELAREAEAYPRELATMGWERLRALPGELVEIGSHTVSHAHLTGLADSELAAELGDSRRRIEDELGRPCRYLAYPFGEQDARVRAAAREAGYTAAFALAGGPRPVDDYALPRIGLFPHDRPARTIVKSSRAGRYVAARLDMRRQGGR
jgi:peptidoglycan/xylan/chitin deacetylase (PgdA/CDA1 family)